LKSVTLRSLLLLSAFTVSSSGNLTAQPFSEVAESVGIDHLHQAARVPSDTSNALRWMGSGVAAEDFNGDGWIDLFVTQGDNLTASLLYENQQGSFVNVAAERNADIISYGMGAAAADYDNDGDIDIFQCNVVPPHQLLINDGTGNFAVREIEAPNEAQFHVTSPSFGDINNDGFLELALGQWNDEPTGNFWIYHNDGQGNLTPEVFHQSQDDLQSWVYSPRFSDVNDDGYQDLLITSDFVQSQLWINNGDGTFENITSSSGVGIDRNGMGATVGDFDNDLDLDWFVTSIFQDNVSIRFGNRLYDNINGVTFDDVTENAGVEVGHWGWGATTSDFDLDADLDIFHVNGYRAFAPDLFKIDPSLFYENQGDGTFVNKAEDYGTTDTLQGRGVVSIDYDRDGDIDIFVANNSELQEDTFNFTPHPPAPALLYRNDLDTNNHWISFELDAELPFQRQGIGSRLIMRSTMTAQTRELHASTNYMSQEVGRIAHFGLLEADDFSELEIKWVNGDRTIVYDLDLNSHHEVRSNFGNLSAREIKFGETLTCMVDPFDPSLTPEWIIDSQTFSGEPDIVINNLELNEVEMRFVNQDQEIVRREFLKISVSPSQSDAYLVF